MLYYVLYDYYNYHILHTIYSIILYTPSYYIQELRKEAATAKLAQEEFSELDEIEKEEG